MKTLLFTLIVFLSILTPAAAQNEADSQIFITPGSGYTNQGNAIRQALRRQSQQANNKISVGTVEVSLVHYHYMEPDQFGIMMKAPNALSGCFDISPLEYEASFVEGHFMDIKVKDFRRTPSKTKDVAFDCDQKTKVISGLVVVSAKDLQKRGVRQIRFSSGRNRDAYDVVYRSDSIQLIPDSQISFKAVGLVGADKNKLVHYFGGKNIVALHVPMAAKGDDIAQSVRTLAHQNALQPIFEQEGLDTSGTDNIYFFTDPKGAMLSGLNEDGYSEIGSIQVPRAYNGPQGRQGTMAPLKVFVTRPGTKL